MNNRKDIAIPEHDVSWTWFYDREGNGKFYAFSLKQLKYVDLVASGRPISNAMAVANVTSDQLSRWNSIDNAFDEYLYYAKVCHSKSNSLTKEYLDAMLVDILDGKKADKGMLQAITIGYKRLGLLDTSSRPLGKSNSPVNFTFVTQNKNAEKVIDIHPDAE